METAPLLFDLGRSPTTRQVADLVKTGGAEALTEATRRADRARYLYLMPVLTFAPPEQEIVAFRDVVFPRLRDAGVR